MTSNLRKLPNYTQLDLFHADFNDIAMRALQEVMERPFFALTNNKPRFEPIVYKTRSAEVTISGGKPHGIATIFDHDILMWIISQIVEARDDGQPTSPQMDFTPYKCLQGIYRRTGGHEYQLLTKALHRLANTYVTTSIRKEDQIPLKRSERRRLEEGFHWIEGIGIQYVERNGKEAPEGMTVVIPNWLYRGALKHGNILTIDERYFLMRSGLERVLYMIARKHVGRQDQWQFTIRELYEKTGSEMPYRDFAKKIRKIVARDPLPEYSMTIYRGQHDDEIVIFSNRRKLALEDPRHESPRLDKRIQRLRVGLIPDDADEARQKLYARRGIDLKKNAEKVIAEHDVDNS